MKTLFLLRHAKSSHEDATLNDFDRPLNERGKRDAKVIGNFIRQTKVVPDLVVSSPAERARQTIELVLKSARLKLTPKFEERIYEASMPDLLKIISKFEDTSNSAMLVGHNPGFEELFKSLTTVDHSMPTATLACVELSVETWSRVRAGKGRFKFVQSPKKLRKP